MYSCDAYLGVLIVALVLLVLASKQLATHVDGAVMPPSPPMHHPMPVGGRVGRRGGDITTGGRLLGSQGNVSPIDVERLAKRQEATNLTLTSGDTCTLHRSPSPSDPRDSVTDSYRL
eukprot:1193629-Prorocentrum_minimum.AAC.3